MAETSIWFDEEDEYSIDEDELEGELEEDRPKKEGSSTQWLLSMTDMVTLMLTFFVFTFSQSVFFNVDKITV